MTIRFLGVITVVCVNWRGAELLSEIKRGALGRNREKGRSP